MAARVARAVGQQGEEGGGGGGGGDELLVQLRRVAEGCEGEGKLAILARDNRRAGAARLHGGEHLRKELGRDDVGLVVGVQAEVAREHGAALAQVGVARVRPEQPGGEAEAALPLDLELRLGRA